MRQIYATKAQIAAMTGRDWKTVSRRIKEMRDLVSEGIFDLDRDFAGSEVSIDAYLYHLNHVRPHLPDLDCIEPFVRKR